MSQSTPRMRMFAGPNGSGKSTLKSVLPSALLGIYLNPDEIEESISKHGFLDLSAYGVKTGAKEVLPFFVGSAFLKEAGFVVAASSLRFANGRLELGRAHTGRSVWPLLNAD